MEFKYRWHVIGELGEGGQGKVHRVLDKSRYDMSEISQVAVNSIRSFCTAQPPESQKKDWERFHQALIKLVEAEDSKNHGALKVLHEPKEARDPERGQERIAREIEAMSKVSHPNLLKILDHDPDGKWFVSQFHSRGTLSANKQRFTGDFVGALRAFRPLVQGVSVLHDKKIVHRDIKPQNVFVDSNSDLVLGDFGLVFFEDAQHTRISGTFENVGTRDWMPGWAVCMRIEEIRPTFDVFSLGKLLWAMVSRLPMLTYWYFERPQFDLQRMFPDTPYIKLANTLFKKCIVEDEENCLPHANALLEEVDKTLRVIDMNADLLIPKVERLCKVCGLGSYKLVIDREQDLTFQFGLRPEAIRSFKIFMCTHCGNVQLFAFRENQSPPAWAE